jgi:hypothetical protein
MNKWVLTIQIHDTGNGYKWFATTEIKHIFLYSQKLFKTKIEAEQDFKNFAESFLKN